MGQGDANPALGVGGGGRSNGPGAERVTSDRRGPGDKVRQKLTLEETILLSGCLCGM